MVYYHDRTRNARTSLLENKRNDGSIALGVIPTFAFGIFAYQNPPNVVDNQIELTDFQFSSEDNKTLSI